MRAWSYTNRGAPSKVLKLRHDLPQPQPTDLKPHEVLIKVSHVGLFPPEAQLMSVIPHPNSEPWFPGKDFSGTIVAVGDESPSQSRRTLNPGDRVFGMINPKKYPRYNGSLAEYLVAPRESVVLVPKDTGLDEASTLAAGGCTIIGFTEQSGWIKINDDRGTLSFKNNAYGKRILITGGSTATGLLMLQLAKLLVGVDGLVVTTSSPRHEEVVKSLGADEVIDYTKHPQLHEFLIEHYSSLPFDMIMDISGTDPLLWPKCPAYLNADGYFAFAGMISATHSGVTPGIIGSLAFVGNLIKQVMIWQLNTMWPVALGGVPRKAFFHSGSATPRRLELVRQLVEEGKIKGVIDTTWDMEDVLKAYEHIAAGKIRGKVVVNVQS